MIKTYKLLGITIIEVETIEEDERLPKKKLFGKIEGEILEPTKEDFEEEK